MPMSLRLPADIETQIASFAARTGLTKSAVIVRSIQSFLAQHDEAIVISNLREGDAGRPEPSPARRCRIFQKKVRSQGP